MPQIADTGFLVAFWSKSDAHHHWARGLTLRAPLHTCEAVLTEAAYLLGQPEPLLQMLVDGDLVVDFDARLHAPEFPLVPKRSSGTRVNPIVNAMSDEAAIAQRILVARRAAASNLPP